MKNVWDYDKWILEQIEEIKKLQMQGYTTKQILDMDEFSLTALNKCGLPVSYLIPQIEPSLMDCQEWNTHTSAEYKWELYDGKPFSSNGLQRDRVLLGLLYSAGLKHLLEILPKQSLKELKQLLKD